MAEYEYDPRATLPEDAKWVAPHEGHEHGYWGAVPDQEPNESYTVAGVTGGTDQVPAGNTSGNASKPSSRSTSKAAPKDDDK